MAKKNVLIILFCVFFVSLGEMRESYGESNPAENSENTITEFINFKPIRMNRHELAGIVIDEKGQPLEGVYVDAWPWPWESQPGQETYTDAYGRFKITNLESGHNVDFIFSKDGYSPKTLVRQEIGIGNVIVRMIDKTFLEGIVRAPDGTPVPDANILATYKKEAVRFAGKLEFWIKTRTKSDGSYRLYLEPNTYDIRVRVPGIGGARSRSEIVEPGDSGKLDFDLVKGVDFRAKVTDSLTNNPVENMRLSVWPYEDFSGTSDSDGIIEITDLFTGRFKFDVESDSHTRWWAEDARHGEQRETSYFFNNFQMNFYNLTFNIEAGMETTEIVAEKCVRIFGRVLDPDGNPVAGATVSTSLTGKNLPLGLTTHFSVETKEDGSYEMVVPASGKAECNLVAHDGKYGEWRKWSNGFTESFKTIPGQIIRGRDIKLTRPASVKGRVVYENGSPRGNHRVRVTPVDMRGNGVYDPQISTDKEGNFTLDFISPGENYIQPYPYNRLDLDNEKTEMIGEVVKFKPGDEIEGIELVVEVR
ncbi:carboxypeptidase regulatory-like domain-containing protein [Candidatus Latescibacterota bacterium]